MYAKGMAIFFGATTVLIAVLLASSSQSPFAPFGIADQFVVPIVIANFLLLCVSLVFFIYQRAHKEMPEREKLRALEQYAEIQLAPKPRPEFYTVNTAAYMQLQALGTPVTLTPTEPTDGIMTGDTIKISSVADRKRHAIVTVIGTSTDSPAITVRSTYFPE